MRSANKAVFRLTMAVFVQLRMLRLRMNALFCHTKAVFLQIQCALDYFVPEIRHHHGMLENNVARISNAEPFLDIVVRIREIGHRKLGVKERRL